MSYDARSLNLLRELTVSQHKLKDQSTFFGFLWSFLNPLIMVGVLFLFFHHRLGEGVDHYGLYLLLGLVPYTNFANATSRSMRVLLTLKPLTKEAVFPKELLVVSSTLSHSIDLTIAMGFCFGAAYLFGVKPSFSQLYLPVVLAVQFLLILWVSLILSCAFLVARDIEHIYQAFLRVLLFLTPVFYTSSFLGVGLARQVVWLNPLTHVIELFRTILLDGAVPPGARVIELVVINGLLAGGALRLFKACEPRLAEYV
jgi:ABC-type polysaccharide/polyol phosphate export permease